MVGNASVAQRVVQEKPQTKVVFDPLLGKVLANERKRYICMVFSHWLRRCSAMDMNQHLVI